MCNYTQGRGLFFEHGSSAMVGGAPPSDDLLAQLEFVLVRASRSPELASLNTRVDVYIDGSHTVRSGTTLLHDQRARQMAQTLEAVAPNGEALCPAPVAVVDSARRILAAKRTDVAWSTRFESLAKNKRSVAFPVPEICIEILECGENLNDVETFVSELFSGFAREMWEIGRAHV